MSILSNILRARRTNNVFTTIIGGGDDDYWETLG